MPLPKSYGIAQGWPLAPGQTLQAPSPAGSLIEKTLELSSFGIADLLRLAPELADIPDGNAVALTTGGLPVGLTEGRAYIPGTNVIPAPNVAYNGTAGSGWASRPTDATRTTAKPIVRLAFRPHRRITEPHALLIFADAAGGLASLEIGVEGSWLTLSGDSLVKNWLHYTDGNGLPASAFGYVAEIDPDNYRSTIADPSNPLLDCGVELYVRATALDGTMQTRTIGVGATRAERLVYYPAYFEHGVRLQVTPSGADAWTGATYPAVNATFTTLKKAIDYAKGLTVNAHSITAGCGPLIEITENCDIACEEGAAYVNGTRAYLVVTHLADVSTVTFNKPGPSIALWNPGYCGIEFRGPALFFDATYLWGFATSPSQTDRYWYEFNAIGGNVCDWDMATEVDDTGYPRGAWGGVGARYQRDCKNLAWTTANGVTSGAFIPSYCVNNRRYGLAFGDVYNGAAVQFGDRADDVSADVFRTPLAGCGITYSGAGVGSIRTTKIPGLNGNSLWLRVDGVDVHEISFTGLRLAGLAAAINAYSAEGWSASSKTTPGDRATDRAATYLSPAGALTQAAWGATLTTGVEYVASTAADIHADLWQSFGGYENCYFGYFVGTNFLEVQCVFLDGTISDSIFENVFIENEPNGVYAQIGKTSGTVLSHIILRDYSVPAQGLKFVNNAGAGWADAYCRAEGLVFLSFQWGAGASATAYPILTDCHFCNGYTNEGAQVAVNTSTGGSEATLYPGLGSDDLTPAAQLALEENLISPHTEFDALGQAAPALSPKGATMGRLAASTISSASAKALAAVTWDAPAGEAAGWATLTYRQGAGETGPLDQIAITFDVV